jgi:hypothetical protein
MPRHEFLHQRAREPGVDAVVGGAPVADCVTTCATQ